MLLVPLEKDQSLWVADNSRHATRFDQILFISAAFEQTIPFASSQNEDQCPAARSLSPRPLRLSAFVKERRTSDAVSGFLRKHGAIDHDAFPSQQSLTGSDVRRLMSIRAERERGGVVWYPPVPCGNESLLSADSVYPHAVSSGLSDVFFSFSTSDHHDGSCTLVPSIAYQIAEKLPRYKLALLTILANNPAIFSQNLRIQFRYLISHPFRTLFTASDSSPETITIFLHALDRCQSKNIQREICELIVDQARCSHHFPLNWILYGLDPSFGSNADWPLGRGLDHELVAHEADISKNTLHVLQKEFSFIRQKFGYELGSHMPLWPPAQWLRDIAIVLSGDPGSISFIIHFVSDVLASDPRGRLEQCMELIYGFSAAGNTNRSQLLDAFYNHLLSDISHEDRIDALSIVSLIFREGTRISSPIELSNFLGISKKRFYKSLRSLHSVVEVPLLQPVTQPSPSLRHSSFRVFLLDPRRSGKNCLRDGDIHFHVAARCLTWLSESLDRLVDSPFPWDPHPPIFRRGIAQALKAASGAYIVNACLQTPEHLIPLLIKQFKVFDFNKIIGEDRIFHPNLPASLDIRRSTAFSRWLYRHDPKHLWLFAALDEGIMRKRMMMRNHTI
ncbi:hypothetical protein NP233_g7568 [Leucocoprinus birnbaumii]|uniref:Nephrocystin 3-like N-terminal domain-containing protein n=1 Tax=Leucocoprinus birnbaumii TaxID=56174 RepID=A0AAD5YUH3_9AGAR|nr:hypothetical protein NP233_g7568 [Leucocoprinus birnbaumii]